MLRDRFGLCVEIKSILNAEDRMIILTRRISYESNPTEFYKEWEEKEIELSHKIKLAQERLASVKYSINDLKETAKSA
jgi:Mg-chelatase subunit ChlI